MIKNYKRSESLLKIIRFKDMFRILFFLSSIISISMFLFIICSLKVVDGILLPDPLIYPKLLPSLYWIGLSLSILSSMCLIFLRDLRERTSLQIISFLIPILYIIGVPCFIYKNPVFTDVYGIIDLSKAISITGHVNLSGELNYPQSFPGMLFWLITMSKILGISPFIIGKYYPIYSFLVLSLFIFIISRILIKEYAFVPPIVHLAFIVHPLYNMVPQNLSLILFISFFFIL